MNVRKGTRIILLALAVLSCGAWAQDAKTADTESATWKTAGQWNGRFWRTLDSDRKIIFLLAYSNAVDQVTILMTEGNFDRFLTASKKFWPKGLTIKEIQNSLDRFYDTPENGPIGIPNVLMFVIAERLSGTDEATIQKKVIDLRQRSALPK